MSVEAKQVQEVFLRPQVRLPVSWVEELNRAISCCLIAKRTSDVTERLRFFLVAEATSAKFMKLRSQGKIGESKSILELMSLVEEELGGRLYMPTIP